MATTQLSTSPPAPGIKTKRNWSPVAYLLITPPVLLMALLIFYPAIQAVITTIFIENPITKQLSLSLQNYIAFFKSPILVANLLFTFKVTLLTVLFLFIVGLPLSLYLRFSKSRMAGPVQVLALFPLFVPGVILAFALIRFTGTHGLFDTMLEDTIRQLGWNIKYTTPYLKPAGIIIALVWENIPFTTLVLTAGLRQVEDSVIESARDVGANNFQVFFSIILPLITRAAMIVFCLDVIGVFGAFTIPYLLGPAQPMMMGVSMQQFFNNYLDRTGALTQAVITFVICSVVGLLYVRTVTKGRKET